MESCSRVLAPFMIPLFLTIAATDEGAKQKVVLHGNVGAPEDNLIDALSAMPRMVTGLKVTASGATSVRVEWKAPAEDVIGYKICAQSLDAHYLEINTSDTSIVVPGLVPASQYVISVSPFIVQNGIVSIGSPVNRTVTTDVVRPPTSVRLFATCDHFIRASWKYMGDKVYGFEVTLREKVGNISEKMTLSAVNRHVLFKIDPCRRNFTFAVRSYVYGQNQRRRSGEVEKTVTSFGQAPEVDGFEARVLTATSARATWKTVHTEDIYISVCPAAHPEEDCLQYSTDGDLLVYVISGLKPATQYHVNARFSLSMNGRVCKYKESSQTITTPAQAPPSLQARAISVSETTATVVVERLPAQEFVRLTMSGEERIYHDRIFTLRGLVPSQKYMLQIAACAPIMTCSAWTELEVMTPAASSSPSIEIVEVGKSSIAIRWALPEEEKATTANYRVGYRSANGSLADVTSAVFYRFTSLKPNSTYVIYVEALSMGDGGDSIGSPSFVTVSTETEKPQLTDTRVNSIVPALSTKEGRVKPVVRSFVTSSARPGTTRQRSCDWSALPVMNLVLVLTALLCCLGT